LIAGGAPKPDRAASPAGYRLPVGLAEDLNYAIPAPNALQRLVRALSVDPPSVSELGA
jgi:hypothetical protein